MHVQVQMYVHAITRTYAATSTFHDENLAFHAFFLLKILALQYNGTTKINSNRIESSMLFQKKEKGKKIQLKAHCTSHGHSKGIDQKERITSPKFLTLHTLL